MSDGPQRNLEGAPGPSGQDLVPSEAEKLERALELARAVVVEVAPSGLDVPGRLGWAGSSAVESLRACELRPAWSPPAGALDLLRGARHDVRAAAQSVLGQLELIGLAWRSWDEETRSVMLDELEADSRELMDQARRFTGEPV